MLENSPSNSSTNWIHQLRAQRGEQPSSVPTLPPVRGACIVEGVTIDTPRGANQQTTVADIGDGTDAINFLLVAASLPAKLRPLVDCLVGLAGDRTGWFEADDLQVGVRARVGDGAMSRGAARKWVQRHRNALCEWQQSKNLALIEYSPGGRSTGGDYCPSRYRVNLLALAAATVERAREDGFWRRAPHRALMLAAEEIINDAPETNPYKPRFRAPRRDDDALLTRNPKTATTLMSEAARIVHARGEDVNAWLEQHIRELREAVGSVHTKAEDLWTNMSRGAEESVHTKAEDLWTNMSPPPPRNHVRGGR